MKRLVKLIMMSFYLGSTQLAYGQFNTIGDFGRHIQIRCSDRNGNDTVKAGRMPQSTASEEIEGEESIDTIPLSLPYQQFRIVPPLQSIKVTSAFGYRRDPLTKQTGVFHSGTDFRAYYEPVYSMLPGMVIAADYDERSGKYIAIRTGSIIISYCHLSHLYVRQGDCLFAGSIIALSGSTGRSTAPHLHITARINSSRFDVCQLLELAGKM